MTETDELAAIHRAILTEPEEDLHRLAMADCLDERGAPGDEERAWFIRHQCKHDYVMDWAEGQERIKKDGWGYFQTAEQRFHTNNPPDGFYLIGWTDKVWVCYMPTKLKPSVQRLDVQFNRGFVHSITCSSADWIANHEKLFWHPEQTVECILCRGSGLMRGEERWGCHECGGNGHMPGSGNQSRPYQPTAHPITRVNLTTHPDTMKLYELCRKNGMGESPGNRIARHIEILEAEWPWIKFTIPGSSNGENGRVVLEFS